MALKREREEHQHLLAESYAAVMDLTKQVACSGNVVTSGSESRISAQTSFCITFRCRSVVSAADRGEKLGQREAGAAGEIQSGESSVGAETERGHFATGHGNTRVCVHSCVIRRRSEIRSDALMRSKLHVTKSIFADPDCNCTTLTIQAGV